MFKFYGRHEFLTLEHPDIVDSLDDLGTDVWVIPLKEEVVLEVAEFNGNLRQVRQFVDRQILRAMLPPQYNLEWTPLPKNCVIKNNTSMFSDGVKIVSKLTAQNDLAKIAKKYKITPRLMVEEKLDGPQYEISGWVTPNGIFFLHPLEQSWTGNRIRAYQMVKSSKVDSDLKKMIRIIDREWDLPFTAFCVEARYKDGTPRVIDFNMRLGEEGPNKNYHDVDKINLEMIRQFNAD